MGSGIAGNVCGEFLRNLCEDLAWDYAVFWKIRHQIPMLLSWGDGYCNHPRPKLLPEFVIDAEYFNREGDAHSLLEDAKEHPLGSTVAVMSSLCYYVGEGLVGEVAETGNYCWLSCEDLLFRINNEISSAISPEWLPQVSAGIKTVLLLPVLPHGVLQLGSLNMVAEDMPVVAHIAERFISLHNVLSHPWIYLEPKDVQDLLLLPPVSCLSDDMDDMFSIIERNLVCTVDLTDEESTLNFYEILATFTPSEKNWSAPMDDNLEGGVFSSEETYTSDECYSGGFYDTAADYCAKSDLIAPTYVDQVLNDIEDDILGNVLRFSMNCNLEEVFVSNMLTHENGTSYGNGEVDYPVEADSSDLTSNSHNSPIEVGNCDSLMVTADNSRERKIQLEETSVVEREDSVERSVMTTAFSTRPQDSPQNSSMTLSTVRSDLNIANEKDQVAKGSSNEFDQEKQEQTKRMTGCKRKVRPGDNPRPRPRPRDRQLIQDRVKELRELVPNGSKCSIDALLARTVKHMLFLRSVTSRAEKLRKCTSPPGESGRNRRRGFEIATERQSGSTCDLEIAGELQVCPIVVEDLEYPGLMLIEMLCNEHGLFLEISEVLRRLALNIVRGSTEARSNNIWASFVVEASKGFHRIDIFWPLMQLLQRKRNPSTSSSMSSAIAQDQIGMYIDIVT